MNTETLQARLSDWFRATAGGAARPVHFDIDRTYPELRSLDRAYPRIRDEVLEVLKDRDRLPAYHDLDPDQADISRTTPKEWKIYYVSYSKRAYGCG